MGLKSRGANITCGLIFENFMGSYNLSSEMKHNFIKEFTILLDDFILLQVVSTYTLSQTDSKTYGKDYAGQGATTYNKISYP